MEDDVTCAKGRVGRAKGRRGRRAGSPKAESRALCNIGCIPKGHGGGQMPHKVAVLSHAPEWTLVSQS